MVCMAYFDTLYLASSLAIFAVPLVRPPLAHTFLFTVEAFTLDAIHHLAMVATSTRRLRHSRYREGGMQRTVNGSPSMAGDLT